MSTQKERSWELVQIKAFSSWLNGYLDKRNLKIENIQNDLDDGIKLINFLELLSGKKMTQKYDSKPPSRIQKIQNLHIALTFLEKEMGVRNVGGTSAEDFADHNLKMILGFLWSLFKRYRIQTIKHEDKSSEEGLLLWAKKVTDGYRDVSIESYKHSFRSGMAFLALCDRFLEGNKEFLDYDKFSKSNPIENLNTAFDVAEKRIGVPKLLDPEEVSEGNVDERSTILYISLYFHAFTAKEAQKGLLEEKDRIEEQMRGLKGSLEDRAKMAVQLDEENRVLKEELAQLRSRLQTEEVSKLDVAAELAKLKEDLEAEKKRTAELNGKLDALQKEKDDAQKRAQVEVTGLGVLKKNLHEHLEDLYRWQKYLDFDKSAELDFSGEIRPQILTDISKSNFEEQLKYLSDKLDKENTQLSSFLKSKEVEKKAQKQKEKEKKSRQEQRGK